MATPPSGIQRPGIGMFTPAEALYSGPGSYEKVIQGVSSTHASYLVGIDSVNLQVKLQQEQLTQQREIFEKEFSLKEERFDIADERYEREFEREEGRYEGEFGLEERRVGAQETQARRSGSSSYQRGRELDLLGDYYDKAYDIRKGEEKAGEDRFASLYGGGTRTTNYVADSEGRPVPEGSLGEGNTASPFVQSSSGRSGYGGLGGDPYSDYETDAGDDSLYRSFMNKETGNYSQE